MSSDLVGELARKLHDEMKCGTFTDYKSVIVGYERVLREAGLDSLLEAGEAMATWGAKQGVSNTMQVESGKWDKSLAKFQEAVRP